MVTVFSQSFLPRAILVAPWRFMGFTDLVILQVSISRLMRKRCCTAVKEQTA